MANSAQICAICQQLFDLGLLSAGTEKLLLGDGGACSGVGLATAGNRIARCSI
jgi:hypothetical protein